MEIPLRTPDATRVYPPLARRQDLTLLLIRFVSAAFSHLLKKLAWPLYASRKLLIVHPKGCEYALAVGVKRANKALKKPVRCLDKKDQSVIVEKGKILQYRVAMKIAFILAN